MRVLFSTLMILCGLSSMGTSAVPQNDDSMYEGNRQFSQEHPMYEKELKRKIPGWGFMKRGFKSCTKHCQHPKICANNGRNKDWAWCMKNCQHKATKGQKWDMDQLFSHVCHKAANNSATPGNAMRRDQTHRHAMYGNSLREDGMSGNKNFGGSYGESDGASGDGQDFVGSDGDSGIGADNSFAGSDGDGMAVQKYARKRPRSEANQRKALSILELTQDQANCSTIKKQYRRMSLKYHPDRNKGADNVAIMQRINRAKDYLVKRYQCN